ncbi:MAG: DUF2628 domain-containing protein [Rhizobiaceae bacterium]|nr:DUF2628 domain-containing protein [Rhizobiaceae bacterium]
MNTYSIYLPPPAQAQENEPVVKFLVDGNAYFAVLLPPVWLAWHRLWWALGVYIGIVAIILLLVATPWRDAALFLSLIPGLYLWLEGNELIAQKYQRKGWQFVGVIQGANEEDAELRYYELKDAETVSPYSQPKTTENTTSIHRPPNQPQSIGLFPLEN